MPRGGTCTRGCVITNSPAEREVGLARGQSVLHAQPSRSSSRGSPRLPAWCAAAACHALARATNQSEEHVAQPGAPSVGSSVKPATPLPVVIIM